MKVRACVTGKGFHVYEKTVFCLTECLLKLHSKPQLPESRSNHRKLDSQSEVACAIFSMVLMAAFLWGRRLLNGASRRLGFRGQLDGSFGCEAGTWCGRGYCTSDTASFRKPPETELVRHIKTRIMMGGGPISVAEYMKEVLTNPTCGFYMNRDVFGVAGDFTTSPEISQMFGELVGIWSICTWEQMGCPENINIIELGPGRGTLMADFLRGTRGVGPFVSAMKSLHLVEVSDALRKIQAKTLGGIGEEGDIAPPVKTSTGAEVSWYQNLAQVPITGPEIIIAHEFLDALPVHQFVRTDHGWCERLIDTSSEDDPLHFRFVLSPKATPAFALVGRRRLSWMTPDEAEHVKQMEVGSVMLATVVEVAQRVSASGGAALLIDYGKDGLYESSVQAIRSHQFVNLLEDPGFADLSAHVDFSAVRKAVEESRSESITHGPIEQGQFLHSLAIGARLEALCKGAAPEQQKCLVRGYKRLVESSKDNGEGMGDIYKAMAITPQGAGIPVGFQV